MKKTDLALGALFTAGLAYAALVKTPGRIVSDHLNQQALAVKSNYMESHPLANQTLCEFASDGQLVKLTVALPTFFPGTIYYDPKKQRTYDVTLGLGGPIPELRALANETPLEAAKTARECLVRFSDYIQNQDTKKQ